MLPCGNSAIVYLGKQSVEERFENRIPALSNVPYLDRLFRNRSVRTVEQEVYQIVTVRVVNAGGFIAPTRCDVGAVTVAPCCQTSQGIELNLTAPKPVVVPKQVFSFYTGWFGGQ